MILSLNERTNVCDALIPQHLHIMDVGLNLSFEIREHLHDVKLMLRSFIFELSLFSEVFHKHGVVVYVLTRKYLQVFFHVGGKEFRVNLHVWERGVGQWMQDI